MRFKVYSLIKGVLESLGSTESPAWSWLIFRFRHFLEALVRMAPAAYPENQARLALNRGEGFPCVDVM